jgi:hypothetical protein
MNLVSIDLKMPDVKATAEVIKREIPGLIAATLQTQRAMIFDMDVLRVKLIKVYRQDTNMRV